MISQLQEQLAEEKGRAREMEAELKAEVDNLSKSCHSQQQVSHSKILYHDVVIRKFLELEVQGV